MAQSTCAVDGCERGGKIVRGWCTKHYVRWRNHGSPTGGRATFDGEPARWLDAHLAADPTDDCVEWPYSTTDRGYGNLWDGRRMRRVTHLVLERTGRPRPPAPANRALHSCDHPPCVNGRHLRWGSQKANGADMVKRGRATYAKLTASDVLSIRERYAAGGVLHQELADEYGVIRQTVSKIIRRETWKHI